MMRHPGQSLPQQCGQQAPLKAAYRLLECPALQPESIVQSAAAATLQDLQRRARCRRCCWRCRTPLL